MSKMSQNKTFLSPFSLCYWKSALNEFKSIKKITIAAVFIALSIAISTFYIPIPNLANQRIYFSFLVNALGSMIYGPLVGLITGLIGDIIGFIVHPSGAFFFGYTITAMMGSFMYGLFLYKSKLSILRISLCKLSVNILVNVLLNSLWDSILIGKGYLLLIAVRIPKNLIMLPIEIIFLVILFKSMIPILKREKFIDFIPYSDKIKWF